MGHANAVDARGDLATQHRDFAAAVIGNLATRGRQIRQRRVSWAKVKRIWHVAANRHIGTNGYVRTDSEIIVGDNIGHPCVIRAGTCIFAIGHGHVAVLPIGVLASWIGVVDHDIVAAADKQAAGGAAAEQNAGR